jgi:hypothetical protein
VPVKQWTTKERRLVVTETMLELYARGCEILTEGSDEEWEDEGGRRREFGQIDVELHGLLKRRPWEASVFDVDLDGEPPHWLRGDTNDWRSAQELRRQLEAGLAARRRGRAAGKTKREAAPADVEPPRP